jgi:hypothetical protein
MMKETNWLLLLAIVALLQLQLYGQTLRGSQSDRRRSGKRRERPDDLSSRDKGQLFSALSIMYPLDIFNADNPKDWRSPGEFSSSLADASLSKPYLEISRAQDQEDVWLYENWFYGMQNGLIIESGALDGLLFSTSYMFETFANWSAVHVGEI